MTGILDRTKKTAHLNTRRAVDLFMAESAYVFNVYFVGCESVRRNK